MSNSNNVIEIQGLTKRYGEFVALDALTISVQRGHILGLIGPNGAGKTTTIKILVGLSRPTSGKAIIAGADCTRDIRAIKRLVGYMPDKFGSYENMRVWEYLDFFAAAYGIHGAARAKRIEEVMEITSSTYMRDRYVESLSHGMQQRVGIARTLLHNPEVLIFDEPANGLDPKARVEMRELLLALAASGKTLIVTSHILPELSRICNQVAILSGGKLRAYGSLEEIMKQVSQLRLLEIQLTSDENFGVVRDILGEFQPDQKQIEISRAEKIVRFRTKLTEQDWPRIIQTLVDKKIGFSQFREIQTDLEDAYLSVTRGSHTEERESQHA